MRVRILSLHYDKKQRFLRSIRIFIQAEEGMESSLHVLPELLRIFAEKSLCSYVVHPKENTFGRFDVDLNLEYPVIRDGEVVLDIHSKIQRLLEFYYDDGTQHNHEAMPYQRFINLLQTYQAPFGSWTGEHQYTRRILWDALPKMYLLLSPEKDEIYRYLKTSGYQRRIEPMGLHGCRFDEAVFKENQLIVKGEAFSIVFNYAPQGETDFHLMITANRHEFDLESANPVEIGEFELMLRALTVFANIRPNSEKLAIYVQWHPSMGMTMPHFHAQVLKVPPKEKFCEVFLREVNAFVNLSRGVHDTKVVGKKLHPHFMRVQGASLKPKLTQTLLEQKRTQIQYYSIFHPRINPSLKRKECYPDTEHSDELLRLV